MCSRHSMNNLTTLCDYLNGQKLINYNLLKTGGNDPSMTKAMKYSTYVKNSRSQSISKPVNNTNPQNNQYNGLSIHNQKSS